MDSRASDTVPGAEAMAAVVAERDALAERVARLEHQLDWFKRQIFGETSERRPIEAAPGQMSLGEGFESPPQTSAPGREVAAHTRRASRPSIPDEAEESALFFDDSVPVETIHVPAAEADGPDGQLIDEKVSYRLAQRPASYVILKYVRPVVKTRADGALHCKRLNDDVVSHRQPAD